MNSDDLTACLLSYTILYFVGILWLLTMSKEIHEYFLDYGVSLNMAHRIYLCLFGPFLPLIVVFLIIAKLTPDEPYRQHVFPVAQAEITIESV